MKTSKLLPVLVSFPLVLMLLAGPLGASVSAADPSSSDPNEIERQAFERSSPAAFSIWRAGEDALNAGRAADALALFERSHDGATTLVMPVRGACRAALAAKQRKPAMQFCEMAFVRGGATAEDLLRYVDAIVSLDPAPTMTEFVSAAFVADGVARKAPGAVWGPVARFDIGRRVGDRAMMEAGLGEIVRVAPDGPEAKRAQTLIAGRASPWALLARILLVLALAGTFVHASARRRRRARGGLPGSAMPLVLPVLLAFACLGPRVAEATNLPSQPGEFKFNDANPEADVPTPAQQMGDPLKFGYFLQDGLAAAVAASKSGDHARAASYYRALAKAVPQRAYAFARLCDELQLAGDPDGALKACENACIRDGVTVGDYVHTVRLILDHPGAVKPDDAKEIDALIKHLSAEKDAGLAADRLRCEVALRTDDRRALESCTAALATAAPNDPSTISFQWALAVSRKDRAAADRFVGLARTAGMGPAALERMETATRALGPSLSKKIGLTIVAVAGALALAFSARRLMSRRRAAV